MKLYLKASNENKKSVGIGSDSKIQFTLAEGNRVVAELEFKMTPAGVVLSKKNGDELKQIKL